MRSGQVVAHLGELADLCPDAAPAYLGDLVAAKREAEHRSLGALVAIEAVRADVERLRAVLDAAQESSPLPNRPEGHDELHELLVRVRLSGL